MSSTRPLANLFLLRNDMRNKERAVCSIAFTYKNENYYLAFCLLSEEDKLVNPYYILRLCFMRADNLNDYLDCYANSAGISSGLTELRKFLRVEYQPDGIAWERAFIQQLGMIIPTTVPKESQNRTKASITTVCRHEGYDPERIYRWSMIRHPLIDGSRKHRTSYNGQLASVKFPKIYPKYQKDTSISFGFIADPDKERTEEEILASFIKNEEKRDG